MVDQKQMNAAVREFNRMLPGLTSYARTLTGQRNLRIVLTEQGARTDGRVIYVAPPAALGRKADHVRSVCGDRNTETMLQLCPACESRESINILIYHEIAHIAHGSFANAGVDAMRQIFARILRHLDDTEKLTLGESKVSAALGAAHLGKTYMEVAAGVSSFLPGILNALEDVRIDEAMFRARKGTRAMMMSLVFGVMSEGIETPNGRVMHDSQPLNAQLPVAMFVRGTGLRVSGFDPFVAEVLGTTELGEIADKAQDAKDAGEIFELALRTLIIGRRLGFFLESNEERPESPDNQNQDLSNNPNSEESNGQAQPQEAEGQQGTAGTSAGEQAESQEGKGAESAGSNDGRAPERDDSRGGTSDSSRSGGGDDPQDERSGDHEGSGDGGHGVLGELDESELGTGASGSSEAREAGTLPSDEYSDGSDGGAEQGESSELGTEPESSRSGPDLEGSELSPRVITGSAEELKEFFDRLTGHSSHSEYGVNPSVIDWSNKRMLRRAIDLAKHFDRSPKNVSGVDISRFIPGSSRQPGWGGRLRPDSIPSNVAAGMSKTGAVCDMDIPESILGPALMQTRRTFDDNKRKAHEHNLRAGKVNARTLGKRAWSGDPRLFQKSKLPGQRDYSVLIGLDVSGSTRGEKIKAIKRAAMAQAELCHRIGIDFAVYAHSGGGTTREAVVELYEIKSFDDPWDTDAKDALSLIGPTGANLDGHTMELYRKMLEKRKSTDRILMYYTDGAMPEANRDEELVVLREELATLARLGIEVMGVGIGTDSPSRHDLDTVALDGDEDLIKVVRHLDKRLTRR